MNEKEHRARVGRRMMIRRKEIGITQGVLADASGISRSAIANMEAGRQGVTMYMAVKICRALAMSIDTLAGAEPVEEHSYLSTACLHGLHGYCQAPTGKAGPKVPGKCKHCPAGCICGCHGEESQ